ncbi:MAG: VCBS repeat-containing protein, partial [Chloroflexi bacterium]|nr:VCBS repeat-containing protein [Chloroflexota bacterium]
MDSTDLPRISRRRMLVLTTVGAATGLLAAAHAAQAETPTPAALQPAEATLAIPTLPAPSLVPLATPSAVVTLTPAALATASATTPAAVGGPAVAGIDASKLILPQQYPTWSNATGWNQPQQYKTIQLADIDGDHQAELIGRSADGIQVCHWNTTTHLWDATGVTGPMSDKDGWNEESHYLTIQLADIDGDNQAELIGRGVNGIQVYHWNGGSKNWDALSLDGPMTDDLGWAKPEYYNTIQLADLDEDGQLELIGRGVNGIQVFHWDTSAHSWDILSHDGPMTDDDGFNVPKCYSTIRLADIDGDGKPELVGRAPDGLQLYRWIAGTKSWDQLPFGTGFWSDAEGWDTADQYSTIQLVNIPTGVQYEIVGRSSGGLELWVYLGMESLLYYQDGLTLGDFKNANGYDQPQKFSTLQFADVDGDGLNELIVRDGGNGLLAFHAEDANWHPGSGSRSWRQMAGPAGIMTDAAGWDAPECYLTIQAADVDGDGALEIVGRGSDGIQTWKWGTGSGSSAGLSNGLIMAGMLTADEQPTSGPTPASIQPPLAGVTPVATATTAPLATPTSAATATTLASATPTPAPNSTNPPAAALTAAPTSTNPPLARLTPAPTDASAPLAALTPVPSSSPTTPVPTSQASPPVALVPPPPLVGFRAAPTGGTGFYQPMEPGFPDYSQQPGQLLAYQLISQWLLVGGTGSAWPPTNTFFDILAGDIRGQYLNTLLKGQWYAFAEAVAGLKAPPPGVSDADFTTVRQQLSTELRYVNAVYSWFDNTRQFLTLLFPSKKNAVDEVSGALEDYSDDV